MTLNELIDALTIMRGDLESRGHSAAEVHAVVWDADGTAPVTDLDFDRFEEDGPWVVEVRKRNDP